MENIPVNAGFKQFTLVVPQVVVRELDNIKKSVR